MLKWCLTNGVLQMLVSKVSQAFNPRSLNELGIQIVFMPHTANIEYRDTFFDCGSKKSIQAWARTCCVTMSKSLECSEFMFPHL